MLSESIIPTEACSGDNPYPRNEIDASCIIACGNVSINPTINCGTICGKKCFFKIYSLLRPSFLATLI